MSRTVEGGGEMIGWNTGCKIRVNQRGGNGNVLQATSDRVKVGRDGVMLYIVIRCSDTTWYVTLPYKDFKTKGSFPFILFRVPGSSTISVCHGITVQLL